MENLNKNELSGIREEFLKKMKGNYKDPELINFTMKEIETGECSDMASGCRIIHNPCSNHSCRIDLFSPEQ